ncbi:MAG: hypothetical protein A3E83_03280 [Gammaproteobacteria bacterium RIFCSPHIGHO2_12_FULL_41_20]|nr:MAG: hypothetical protein A3E83_03280 [Gammaproteobacteria bacterium RIFCSPHIGHO2_12_FULL_41_20]
MYHLHQAVGILGGTFDPIHFGHLRMALELHNAMDLAEVRFVPCYQPVHRKLPSASPEQRLAMVKKAIATEPHFHVDAQEIRRKDPSFMIDTLIELRKELTNTPLCLLLGIDAFLHFSSWHRWEEIINLSHLIVAHRPQYQLPHTGIIADLVKERLQTEVSAIYTSLGGYILLHPVTSLDISATDIRKQIAMGKNPRYLLPESVYDYIQQQGIYSITRV